LRVKSVVYVASRDSLKLPVLVDDKVLDNRRLIRLSIQNIVCNPTGEIAYYELLVS
jgi:hypothetical protein